MARARSARKNDAPLRMPRRKRWESPASLRMVAPSLAMRLAIAFSLNVFLIFFLNDDLVAIARRIADPELLRDFDAGHPDDDFVPDEQRNAVAALDVDFTINKEILQLFLVSEAEGLKAIAVAAIAHGEAGRRALGELECRGSRIAGRR